jgi:hypothetical protein
MSISIQKLEDDWLNYKPAGNRPLGGRRALLGFNYQLSISLNKFIDQVLNNNLDASMAFEGLSDIAELRDNLVYLTQVKSTLRPQSFKDAINEFLAVDRFLEEKHNDIRPVVRYQIFCRATEGNINEGLSAADLNLDPFETERWNRVRAQLLPYSVMGDPTLELVIKLWNKVSKPFDFVSNLRGDLMRMLAANEPSEKICEQLLKKWQENEIKDSPPGDLLSPSDFHDLSEGKTRILVGQRPSLSDLSEGCFMERSELLQKIIDALRAAEYGSEARVNARIPVVWISGGSGVGKSAMLLQVLRKFMIENDTPVNFLKHFPDQIPKAIRYWRQQAIAAVIAVDDIYAPSYRSYTLWSEINRLAYDAPYLTILTCGPNNYREEFEQQAQREGILQVVKVDIPPLDEVERERFRGWYSARTGQEEVKPIKETNFVIAAFILERRRQGDADIQEFTARLNQRVETLKLTEEFFASLAVNTLGVEAPMSLFNGKRDAVAELVSEGLCQLVDTPEHYESIRWFHPALARTIYDLLVPPYKTEARAINLKRYFISVLDSTALALSFLQLLSKDKKRVIREELAWETLRQIWEILRQGQPPDLRVGLIFEWRKAAQRSGLQVERVIQTGRIRAWMDSPAMNAQGWGLLWQILWDYISPEERDNLTQPTIDWLAAHTDLQEWNFIWQKIWKHRAGDARLIELARTWLGMNSDVLGWNYVFRALYDSGVREEWMLGVALDGLANSPVTVADKYFWADVESLNPTPEVLLSLVTRRLCRSRIAYITQHGIEFIESRLVNVGTNPVIAALYQEIDEAGWGYIFQMLWDQWKKNPTNNAQLIQPGREWLIGREDRPDWNYVWRRLVDAQPDDESLLQQGREWLIGREGRPDWNYVWQRLVDAQPDDESLLQQGREWLIGREGRPDWNYVWQRLVDAQPDDESLLQQGREWLIGREGRPDWNYVWQRLVDAQPDDESLLQQGREWLIGREDRTEYPYVRRKLNRYSSW